MSDEELLKKANLPAKKANKWHEFYKGKIESVPKCSINSYDDFAVWYTPGVAEPCKEISNNISKVYDHTNKGNSIAIISDGSRVLGLGDIGPHAGLPVMEGKSVLFKRFADIDSIDVEVDTTNPEEFVNAVKYLISGSPTIKTTTIEVNIDNPVLTVKYLNTLKKLKISTKLENKLYST